MSDRRLSRRSWLGGRVSVAHNHLMGTCRTGDDAERSVVDRYHRAHDIPNLFMVDGSSSQPGCRTRILPLALVVCGALAADPLDDLARDFWQWRAEAAFFASTPGQAISYQIGKLQIMQFLSDAKHDQGAKFNLKSFHDFVWKNGNVPIALQRWEYVGVKPEGL